MTELQRVKSLLKNVELTVMGEKISIFVCRDQKWPTENTEPRVYIQMHYRTVDIRTEEMEAYKGRKWYLSEHMTDDEIIKTCYLAFRTCVEHEVLEGFRVEGVSIFNPHVDYKELIKVADREVVRSIY